VGISPRHLLIPPLFFAQRKQWPSFAINVFLYGFGVAGSIAAALGAWPLLILTLPLSLLCVAHIADAWRREKAAARAGAQPDRRLPFWAKLVKLGLFLVSLVAIMVLLETLATQTGTPVGPHVLPLFPVMVVTPGSGGENYDAHLILHKDLEDFLQKNPGYTFLVPAGHEKRLRSRLTRGDFTVAQRADGHQAFKVWRDVHPEAYIVGWYEASAKELFPKRFSGFHHMMRGFLFIPALFGSLLVAWIGGKLLRRLGSAQRAEPKAVRQGRG
jgi:hypothetical protein